MFNLDKPSHAYALLSLLLVVLVLTVGSMVYLKGYGDGHLAGYHDGHSDGLKEAQDVFREYMERQEKRKP